MAFPKKTEWSEKTYNAGARGFNFLVDFEKEMWRVFPETQDYNFGKFSDTDINNVMIEGWRHLEGDMFGIENIDDLYLASRPGNSNNISHGKRTQKNKQDSGGNVGKGVF